MIQQPCTFIHYDIHNYTLMYAKHLRYEEFITKHALRIDLIFYKISGSRTSGPAGICRDGV